jgi:flagellar assembly factor FliW
MELLTSSALGALQVDESSVIDFPEGLLGFATLKKFILLEREDTAPFQWLQSLTDPHVALPVVNPHRIFADYSCSPTTEDLFSLGARSCSDLLMLVVAMIPDDPFKTTVNLKAPLLINYRNMLGRQIISECSGDVRARVIPLESQPD